MKKLTLMIAILVLTALACSSIRIADPAFQETPPVTQDALATVLAEVAQATKNAPPATEAPPTETPEQEAATETPESTDVVEEVEPTATPKPTTGNTGFPTALPLPNPSTSKFYSCLEDCLGDGSNHQATFPERVEEIFYQFDYEDFPVKAPYVRKWTKDGELWVQYTCLWPGPESGTEEISLTEPMGLASGIWTLEITVNGETVLEQTLLIDGTYSYWSPPGFFNGCYGQK